jgi:hypothetical protein
MIMTWSFPNLAASQCNSAASIAKTYNQLWMQHWPSRTDHVEAKMTKGMYKASDIRKDGLLKINKLREREMPLPLLNPHSLTRVKEELDKIRSPLTLVSIAKLIQVYLHAEKLRRLK